MLPPNTEEDALQLVRNMRSYYYTMFQNFEEDDNYYEGAIEEEIELPEGFDITIPTTARAIIDEAVDNIEPYDMIIRYAPRGFGKTSQEEAEKVGRFIKNLWAYWREKNSDIDILRDFIKNLFKNGKAVFKCCPDWSLWPELSEAEEERLLNEHGKTAVKERALAIQQLRDENFPIICRSMSPRHIMEDPSMDSRKLWVIEKYDVSIDEVRNKYTKYIPELSQYEPFGYVIYEIWTATYLDADGGYHKGMHWIFVNDTLVHTEDNPYKEIPYAIKHSGFGTETYDGKPEKKAVGFFTRQVKSMLRAEIRRLSHFDALMQQLAFPIAMLPDTLEDQEFDTAPGAINYVPEDLMANVNNIYLQAKLPAPEYMQSISMIQNQIERGTTQRAIRGAGVPGTDSAAQLSMITSQAKLRLEPIKRATEEAVDMVNFMVLRYIYEVLDAKVSIFGAEALGPDKYTLSPKEIGGRYRTKTTFQPNEDQVKERKLVLATDAMTKAGLNPYDALTFAGWENPMEVIARNLAYKMMEEPSVQRQLAKAAMKDWGLDTMELELEELNDSTILQQLSQQLQANMQQQQPQGGQRPPQEPGSQLMQDAQSMPQPQQGGPPPQAAGSPLDMPQQGAQVNDATRMLGGGQ